MIQKRVSHRRCNSKGRSSSIRMTDVGANWRNRMPPVLELRGVMTQWIGIITVPMPSHRGSVLFFSIATKAIRLSTESDGSVIQANRSI